MSIGRSSRSSQNGPLVSIVPVSFRTRILAIFMDLLCSLGRQVKWTLCQSVPLGGLSHRRMVEGISASGQSRLLPGVPTRNYVRQYEPPWVTLFAKYWFDRRAGSPV